MPNNLRKISVSFVSEALQSTSNDPFIGRRDPAFKHLQQKLLRLQVLQIVLGLTLLILSAVAIIEERILVGLGFCLISALLLIFCSVVGIHQTKPKILLVLNVVAVCGLLPGFNYTLQSLHNNFWVRVGPSDYSLEERINHALPIRNHSRPLPNENFISPDQGRRSFTTTVWVLAWLELGHLIPLTLSLIYASYLLRDIHFYYTYTPSI